MTKSSGRKTIKPPTYRRQRKFKDGRNGLRRKYVGQSGRGEKGRGVGL